jgi:hypothetical protein
MPGTVLMDTSSHKPECDTGLQQQPRDWCGVSGDIPAQSFDRSVPRGRLQLVSSKLVLSAGTEAPPHEWQQAFEALTHAHKIAVHLAGHDRRPGLAQMRRWASGSGASQAPLFAPWRCFSPVSLQASETLPALPRAQWAASYLFDVGSDRPAASRAVDVMLMSPHPEQCLANEDCGAALPRLSVLSAMIRAAREEGRSALAIIVPARCCSALARRLLATDRALTQGEFKLEIVGIEDAIGRLMGGAPEWDVIIAMPELRSIVLAILAQTCGVTGPWPMLLHDRGLRLVVSEGLGDAPSHLPLDATVLIQALAIASRKAGLGYEAQCLYESWARLRDRGVVAGGRGSALPYVTAVSDGEFLELALTGPGSSARPLPAWKALGRASRNHAMTSPVGLSLVASR